jgi:hypothetical protein
VLRKVLRTASGEELLEQRNQGTILKLAEQSRLWVDADAFEDLISQAGHATTPDEALALWQQAKALLVTHCKILASSPIRSVGSSSSWWVVR